MNKELKTTINRVKKRDQDIQKELYQRLATLKKWQRQVFPDLIMKEITGLKISDIARKYDIRRETVSRFYHSKEFEDLALLYAKEEIVLELLPLARQTIKDILLNGKDTVRSKVALEIYKMAKLTQIQNESTQKAENIYNVHIENKNFNQLNINELENLAQEKILEIKKLMGKEK